MLLPLRPSASTARTTTAALADNAGLCLRQVRVSLFCRQGWSIVATAAPHSRWVHHRDDCMLARLQDAIIATLDSFPPRPARVHAALHIPLLTCPPPLFATAGQISSLGPQPCSWRISHCNASRAFELHSLRFASPFPLLSFLSHCSK